LAIHAHNTKRIEDKSFRLPNKKKSDGFQYFIERLRNETHDHRRNEGIIYYDEPSSVPDLPLIKICNEDAITVGKEITVACIAEHGDPPTEIFWFIDDEPLRPILDFKEADEVRTVSSTISIIQRNFTADDDGKSLVCQSSHPGHPRNYSMVKHKLLINFKPIEMPTKVITGLEIGDSVEISIAIRSNPKPSSLIWLIGDKKIYYGARTSKYISRETYPLGRNSWNASLHLTNLTVEDTLLNYMLQVKNFVGATDYHIRLGEKSNKQQEQE
jgi:CD80-like C2-set immunoglobulin domain